MDPVSILGVASGVIAVLQMAGALISQSYGYIAALKDAPKDLFALVQELSSLSGLLSALKVQLESDPKSHRSSALELLGKPEGPLDSCKKVLGRVEKRLKRLDDRKLGSYLVGPLKDKIIRQDIEQLERLKSVFQLALYADQMSLSKAIDEYLRKTLDDYKKEQQVLGKHIRDTDDNVAELCRESKRRELEGKVAQDNIQKALEKSEKIQETIGKHAQDTHENVIDLCNETNRRIDEEKKRLEKARRNTIIRWLSTIDHQSNHHAACNLQQPGTGTWFVNGQDFMRWQDTPGSVLWLHGIPGAGKTILTSTIIQNIASTHGNPPTAGTAIVYFYFDFKDRAKQTTTGMLGSLASQLLQKLDKIPVEADTLFKKYNESAYPDLVELLELLKVALAYFTRCFVIIDALDECSEREILLSALDKLIRDEALGGTSARVLLTSRKEHDIETSFRKHPAITRIPIQTNQVDADVDFYVAEILKKDELLQRFGEDLKSEIRVELTQGSRGMFRWVKCQLDTIRELKRPNVIRKALKSLPKTLDDTYDRILLNIRDDDEKELIRRALQLVVYAARPMTLDEVAEAVIIEEGAECLEQDSRFIQPEYLLSICGSLFSFTGGNLGLAHYSVQEYLGSARIRNGPTSMFAMDETKASIEISKTCLTYLGFNDFGTGICLSEADYDHRLRSYPFLEYAARNWFKHVTSGAVEASTIGYLERFWGPMPTQKYKAWRQIYEIDLCPLHHYPGIPSKNLFEPSKYSNFSTLLYPVFWGFLVITHHLLEAGADPNFSDMSVFSRRDWGDAGITALPVAARAGYEKIVENLLQHGADANIQDGRALCEAVRMRRWEVVGVLLRYGANPNLPDGKALCEAVRLGNEEIVKILLQYGADPNTPYDIWNTALQQAALEGYDKVVETLLQHGADPNLQSMFHCTALLVAALKGHDKVIEILLQHGADPNIQVEFYYTALRAAALEGHDKVVEILLQHGADPNIQGSEYGTALHAAASNGHSKVVEVLLQHGVDPNIQGGWYCTSLQAAVLKGHDKVVEILLQYGVDPNIQDSEYGTPLHIAALNGHSKVVEALIQHGIDPNIQGGKYGTALQAAALKRRYNVVKTLLQHGVDPNIQGGRYCTALQAAALQWNSKVVEILLQHGADPNIQGSKYGTALHAAALKGHDKVVEILLQHGADPSIQGGKYGTALEAAQQGPPNLKHARIIEILKQSIEHHLLRQGVGTFRRRISLIETSSVGCIGSIDPWDSSDESDNSEESDNPEESDSSKASDNSKESGKSRESDSSKELDSFNSLLYIPPSSGESDNFKESHNYNTLLYPGLMYFQRDE